jgi:hypothetical protein
MECPRQGVRSTRHPPQDGIPPIPQVLPSIDNSTISINNKIDDDLEDSMPFIQPSTNANVIESNNNSTANVVIFAAFADKRTGILYSDLTGTLLFMYLKENVCFLVVCHYGPNAILALPITNFANDTILAAYQQQFVLLESKGHKIKVNVIDNQASKLIKKYLSTQKCNNLLIKPNNHRVNAAERTIQTFKAHFICALATTDSNFPLQLWDRLSPQVEAKLNMLRPACIDPTMLVYEVHGPYDWNRFPLAPPRVQSCYL